MIALASGLLAGMIHVLSGPDHVAAIAPLTLANWRKAVAIGFRWGVGHSSGVLFVGFLALLAREAIPLESFSALAERLVGVLLAAIGLWGLRRALKTHLHTHEHAHDGFPGRHLHFHAHAEGHTSEQRAEHQHTHAAFLVGTVHGLAGGSHIFGVLPALVFQTRGESITYLSAFGAGTVLGMITFSCGLGLVGRKYGGQPRIYKLLASTASSVAIVIGCYWVASV